MNRKLSLETQNQRNYRHANCDGACGVHASPTGPKPPPADITVGCLLRSRSIACWWGVWDVESLQGSRSTLTSKEKEKAGGELEESTQKEKEINNTPKKV